LPDRETAGRYPLVLQEFGLPHLPKGKTGLGLDCAESRKSALRGCGSNLRRLRLAAVPCPSDFPALPVPADRFPPPAAARQWSPDSTAAHWENAPHEAGNESPLYRRFGWQPSWEVYWNSLHRSYESALS